MLSSILMLVATVLLAPWWPGDPQVDSSTDRLPVVLEVGGGQAAWAGGIDTEELSRRVVDGVAARLRGRGVVVQRQQSGAILVQPATGGSSVTRPLSQVSAFDPSSAKPVTLTVGFGSSSTPYASGTETRFGGTGDSPWRLGSQLQRHLVRGLWDVLGYDSYDRGVLDEGESSSLLVSNAPSSTASSAWVAANPLFVTNPRERALLEWPDTVDLLSSAIADAIWDYWDLSQSTPPRTSRAGWRSAASWQPVTPRLVTGSEQGPRMALTFDGGASSVPTPAILRALREAGVRATMFMTADFIDQNPELVVQMARDGHEFGNHSATHPDMTGLSEPAIISQLDRVEQSLHALTGKSTRPWFRPPFGAQDSRLVQIAAGQGYNTVLWTADSADWREDVSAGTVERRLLNYAAPGAILIEHLGSPQSAQVLPEVLRLLKERGMTFGTLSEVLGGR